MNTSRFKAPGRSEYGRSGRRFAAWTVCAALWWGSLFALAPPVLGQGHGGHGGGSHGGGGHAGGGHSGGGHGGGSGHIGGGHAGGGGHVGVSHSTPSRGGVHVGSGVSHSGGNHLVAPRATISRPSAGHVITASPRVAHSPGNFATGSGHAARPSVAIHAPGTAHSTVARPGQHFDAARWTGGHASASHGSSVHAISGGHSATSASHGSSVFAAAGGHSGRASAASHTAGIAHSTFNGGGNHFDAGRWTSGHHGDTHHFGALHHDRHDFHPVHFAALGFGLGWGWRSYSYYPSYSYPSPYYDYPPSYYEVPAYPDTNSPPVYDPNGAPATYVTPLPGATSTATETRHPEGFIPRTELPSQEAPEALPEEKPATPPPNTPPLKSPESKEST